MKTLVVYLMAMPETPELARVAVESGADIVELGFPFSDPLADGPVIRRAGERALAAGMRTGRCLDVLAQTRTLVDVPVVVMTYASIFDAYGWEKLEQDARSGQSKQEQLRSEQSAVKQGVDDAAQKLQQEGQKTSLLSGRSQRSV